MTTDDIKRLNYYERQFLRARDFQDEQAYHIEMRRRHLVGHHTEGIVVGLEITQDAASNIWSVGPGLAIDGFGREVVVFEPEPLDTIRLTAIFTGVTSATPLKVWIAYRLEPTTRPAPGYEICDQPDQFIRVRETFRLIYQDDPPTRDQNDPPKPFEDLTDDPSLAAWPVLLGTITWDPATKAVSMVDPGGRRHVGLVGAEISPPLVAQAVPPGATPEKSNLTLRGDEVRINSITTASPALLIVEGNVQINGGELDLRLGGGNESGAPLRAFRGGTKDFRVKIGDAEGQAARFIVGPGTDDKFVVEANGTMTAAGEVKVKNANSLSLEGGIIALKNEDGTDTPDLTEISRGDNGQGHKDLRLAIGTSGDPGARLVVGAKQGNNVEEKFVVGNDGEVKVAGRLTHEGFTLFHRGAELVISGRTGGNPRALVDLGQRLIVNFANDYSNGVLVQGDLEVEEDLTISGDLSITGTVDGRDVAADGTKLDGISASAKNVEVLMGSIAHLGTIPLPAGFIESQCKWLVSPRVLDPSIFDINENGPNAQFRVECFTQSDGFTNRQVVVRWFQQGHLSTPGFVAHNGTANYIIIGVK